jgi:hypothetical protein
MARLTITLSDETHRNLKVRAALHDRTIGDLIEEELAIAREARRKRALETLDKLQELAAPSVGGMTEDEVMELAVEAALSRGSPSAQRRSPRRLSQRSTSTGACSGTGASRNIAGSTCRQQPRNSWIWSTSG